MRTILSTLMLAVSLSLSATSKDTLNAVTMVSYEQRWLDTEGTLALKNNTNEDIHNVTYRITYLDMKGNALDYEVFSSNIEIAPGMTRKVNIPAYEHDRDYSYYLSEAKPYMSHKFKIRFELTGYNKSNKELSETPSAQDSTPKELNPTLSIALALVAVLFAIGLYIGMYVLVALMAKRRNRNAALWVLVSLFSTPLLAIIILLCLGKKYNPYEYMKEK